MADPVSEPPRPSAPDDVDELVTGEGVGLDVRPAGFVLRAAGSVIDGAVALACLLLLLALVGLAAPGLDGAAGTALDTAALAFSFVVLPLVIELATEGRSLGRLVVGARIVRLDGGAVQFRHSFVRALMGSVEIFATLGGLASLVALIGPRAGRLGDLLAGTYSQLERVPRRAPVRHAVPPGLADWARDADVARLPDPLSRRIAAFLAHADSLTPSSRDALARELAGEAAERISPVPRAGAEDLLRAVAALRSARDARRLALERARVDRLVDGSTALPHGFPER